MSNYNLKESLRSYFGFDKFKGSQEEIIENLLEKRNTFVIMPTGGGKSLCYQLPSFLLPGTAVIVSPLIALMKNQVDAIRGFGSTDAVAHFLGCPHARRLRRAELLPSVRVLSLSAGPWLPN